jgi:hypothetical protein
MVGGEALFVNEYRDISSPCLECRNPIRDLDSVCIHILVGPVMPAVNHEGALELLLCIACNAGDPLGRGVGSVLPCVGNPIVVLAPLTANAMPGQEDRLGAGQHRMFGCGGLSHTDDSLSDPPLSHCGSCWSGNDI